MSDENDNTFVLPDGSAVSTASLPLPKDHWLYANHVNIPPMGLRVGIDDARLNGEHDRESLAEHVRAAAKYAVRTSTMNGNQIDFDPDALVQNMIVGLLGYYTSDGTSEGALRPKRR